MTSSFALDKSNAKLMGVCAGLARWTGVDALVVRLALFFLTIFAFGPVAMLAYVLVGWFAETR